MLRLFSAFSLVFLCLILVLPLLLIDGLILYVGGVAFDSLVGCLVFLLCFYLASLLVSVIFDGVMRALGGLFKHLISNVLFAAVNFWVSLSVLLLMDLYVETITISFATKVVLIFVHTSLFYLIHQSSDSTAKTFEVNEPHDPVVKEALRLLENEDPVTCVETLCLRFPDRPKKDIIRIVHRLHSN
ncbi:hypothetical protein ADM98_08665 [Exiguobacterium sp. BMC-KP]|uniref:hypothetical protein n=1 Tax=Exiguobacterium sp. BMC-KP TaxID=1684312 RepID=UPI0006AA4B8D|nr:hypothetical protein [Exiguobacterium sp. BMC-KP]KOP28984.1 hypothetical protein ADM98_08665 [Exiguobacterium sp. BMC-KP]